MFWMASKLADSPHIWGPEELVGSTLEDKVQSLFAKKNEELNYLKLLVKEIRQLVEAVLLAVA